MFENCTIFNPNIDALEIKHNSRGISLEDTARCFGYEFAELPEPDQRFLKAMHMRGRAEGLSEAADHLFSQMKTARNGGALAVQYLQNFSEDWPTEGIGTGGNGLNFKVVLTE